MSDDAFKGFPAETFRFLKGLTADNSKVWFDAHRGDYDAHYVAPARDFVAALGPRLQEISPHVQFAPKINGSIFRINRDIRFSKDKTPYKNHLDMWFWHGERKGWGAPGFYFRLTADRLVLGTGMHRFDKLQAEAFRAAVVDERTGKSLEKTLKAVSAAGPYELDAPGRKTVPRGFDKDHPRASLLLHNGLTVGTSGKVPAVAGKAGFVEFCADHYAALVPLTRWLLDNVSDGS